MVIKVFPLAFGHQVLPFGYQGLPFDDKGLPFGHQGFLFGHLGFPFGQQVLPFGNQGLPFALVTKVFQSPLFNFRSIHFKTQQSVTKEHMMTESVTNECIHD